MEIKRIFVVGAGTMGNGIAQTAAVSGYHTTMTDIDPKAIDRAKASITRSVDKLTTKGVITEEQRAATLSIATSTDLEPIWGSRPPPRTRLSSSNSSPN